EQDIWPHQSSDVRYACVMPYTPSYVTYFFFFMLPLPPTSTLFPYTTLFRSQGTPYGPETARARSSERHDPTNRRGGRHDSWDREDRKSTRLNSSHLGISYAVFCLKKKIIQQHSKRRPN